MSVIKCKHPKQCGTKGSMTPRFGELAQWKRWAYLPNMQMSFWPHSDRFLSTPPLLHTSTHVHTLSLPDRSLIIICDESRSCLREHMNLSLWFFNTVGASSINWAINELVFMSFWSSCTRSNVRFPWRSPWMEPGSHADQVFPQRWSAVES